MNFTRWYWELRCSFSRRYSMEYLDCGCAWVLERLDQALQPLPVILVRHRACIIHSEKN